MALEGHERADVAIVGGGYTGLWTAYELIQRAPSARVVVLEQGRCGEGPSGRNAGFLHGWWDVLPTLVELGRPAAGAGALDYGVHRSPTRWVSLSRTPYD